MENLDDATMMFECSKRGHLFMHGASESWSNGNRH